MKIKLIHRKYRILSWMIAFSLLLFAQTTFAGSVQTSIIASCSVIRTSTAPLKILEAPQTAAAAAGVLKDLNIRCPVGSAVTISVLTETTEKNRSESLSNCPVPSADSHDQLSQQSCPNTPHYHFYKNSSCTELWNPGEEQTFIPDTKHPASAPAVYSKLCKKNPGDISLKHGESVTILTITLEY